MERLVSVNNIKKPWDIVCLFYLFAKHFFKIIAKHKLPLFSIVLQQYFSLLHSTGNSLTTQGIAKTHEKTLTQQSMLLWQLDSWLSLTNLRITATRKLILSHKSAYCGNSRADSHSPIYVCGNSLQELTLSQQSIYCGNSRADSFSLTYLCIEAIRELTLSHPPINVLRQLERW